MYDITQLRHDEFPHAARQTYLNHAGISPLPQRTVQAVNGSLEQLAGNPAAFWMNEGVPAAQRLNREVARLINAESPDEIEVATSTGAALGAIARALPLEPGDNILFCEIEFPSNAFPWMSLAQDGVETRCVPTAHGGLTLETVRQYADERTRVIAASAIQFFTGHRTDLAAIGAFCREQDILFIVDAIQAIGHMPIDVQTMGIDILASGGQKSLLALPGIGILYVRNGVCETLKPFPIASNAVVNYLHWLDYDMTPAPGAARFAQGTPNLPGMFGLLASLSLLDELGVDNIDRHTTGLSLYTRDRLAGLGFEVITPEEDLGPIVTFRSGHTSEQTDRLMTSLAERGIVLAKHLDAAGTPHIRASYHCYNTRDEIDYFIRELAQWQRQVTTHL